MEQEQIEKMCLQSSDKNYHSFLLNEGWKYDTEATAIASYERLKKSKIGEPLTWDEFWAELRMEGDSSAAQELYKTLQQHMKNGALSAYKLYEFARYRWCIRCPEAVVAYQVGPKHWAVNNCSETISEDRAILLLNSEWGFEASRIKLLGTPYYDATDWNYLCFRCGACDWVMQDGELYQIYQ